MLSALLLGLSLSQGLGLRLPAPRSHIKSKSALQMAIYSSAQGVPAALVEERDACGVVSEMGNRVVCVTTIESVVLGLKMTAT
jgi:hypothetical protein